MSWISVQVSWAVGFAFQSGSNKLFLFVANTHLAQVAVGVAASWGLLHSVGGWACVYQLGLSMTVLCVSQEYPACFDSRHNYTHMKM